MAKESRPNGKGSQDVQDTPGKEAPADSRPAGKGGELFHINEQGEYCFGTDCFSMRIKPGVGVGAGEIKVVIDRNECDVDAQAVVDALFGEVVKGVPTVYEAKSKLSSS